MLKNITRSIPKERDIRIFTSELTENQSYKFIHLLGYAILGFMAFDYAALLIPPQLFNPSWELSTIGRIIESVWVTLIGLMLIFLRPDKQSIKRSELRILSLLSWLSLILGIVCFLFAPLLISNSLRINNTNQTQINFQLTNQSEQAEQMTLQLDSFSKTQIQNIWQNMQPNSASISNISLAEKKQQLSEQINSKKQKSKQQLQQQLKGKQRSLFKMTFKWVLGAILAGFCFVSLWKYTEWTREFVRAAKQEI